jgi:DNA-binding PadR family transcriptional regulator
MERASVSKSRGAGVVAPLSATDFHVLMVLTEGASYGYAIMKAVAEQSGGAVSPEIGSLYRVLARLMTAGWVREAKEPAGTPVATRGRDRRYYALTPAGRRVVKQEANRLAEVVSVARDHRLLGGGAT